MNQKALLCAISVASFNVEDFSLVFLHPVYYFIPSVCPTIISDSTTFGGLTVLVFPRAEFKLNRHRFLNFTFLSPHKKMPHYLFFSVVFTV